MISGLSITREFITPEEEAELLALADTGVWKPHALGGRHQLWHDQIPDHFLDLAARVYGTPYRLLIREYLPGQGMQSHMDVTADWKIHGGIVSLLSDADWAFTRGSVRAKVRVPARSLFTLAGSARYECHHEVLPVKERRVSLYFSFKEKA